MKKTKNNANKDKVIETLYEELERKDKLIEKLREENKIILKTALKTSERLKQIEESLKNKR